MRISDWSSDGCSADLGRRFHALTGDKFRNGCMTQSIFCYVCQQLSVFVVTLRATIAPTDFSGRALSEGKMRRLPFRVDLRRLILWMCLFFVFLALGNSLYAAYQVQRGLLLQHSLDTNRAYADKLAHATDSFLSSSRSEERREGKKCV